MSPARTAHLVGVGLLGLDLLAPREVHNLGYSVSFYIFTGFRPDKLTGTVKKELDFSSIPAKAFHQAMKAVINPKIPAALFNPTWTCPSSSLKWAMVRRRKVMSRKKKRAKKARVDLKVQRRHMKVKMNHLL